MLFFVQLSASFEYNDIADKATIKQDHVFRRLAEVNVNDRYHLFDLISISKTYTSRILKSNSLEGFNVKSISHSPHPTLFLLLLGSTTCNF